MESAILLKKLIEKGDDNISLYRAYIDAVAVSYDSPSAAFNQCIQDLKMFSEAQYDYQWLTVEAQKFDISRRDYRELCDMICVMLGDKIKDTCVKPVLTKPSQYEDFCPYKSEAVVLYYKRPITIGTKFISDDKETYHVIDAKLETTPYYEVYCHLVELCR